MPLLKNFLNDLLNTQDDWRLELTKNWECIVGDLGKKMNLKKIQGDCLVVGVYDAHWMQELFMLTETIRVTINERLRGEFVKDIRFVLSERRKEAKQKIKKQEKKVKKIKSMTDVQKKALNKIKDDKLKSALESFLLNSVHTE